MLQSLLETRQREEPRTSHTLLLPGTEEGYARKRANDRIKQLHILEPTDDIAKYLESLESFMKDANIPEREWKHVVHNKLPTSARQALADMITNPGVTYPEYKEALNANMGCTWKLASSMIYLRFPHAWRDLMGRELLSTLKRCFVSILPPQPADETLSHLMRSWIWEQLSDENRKLLMSANLSTLKDLTAACQDLADAQGGYLFPNRRDKYMAASRFSPRRQGNWKNEGRFRQEADSLVCYKCGEKGHTSNRCNKPCPGGR